MEFMIAWFRKIYRYVFGYEPSEFSSELFRYFTMAAGSTGIATILTFGVNILAARYMGPSEFGKWNIIGSWSEFLVIIPLFGMVAAMPRYLGATTEVNSKSIYVGSAFRLVLTSSIICLPILWLIQSRFHIMPDRTLAAATFLYAVILTFFYFLQAVFQGLKQFKRLSILWIISAVGFVVTVLIYLFILHNHSYQSLYLGNVCRLAFIVAAGLIVFAPMFSHSGRGERKELMHFGSYSMLSIAAGFFSLGAIDNIMINHYLGTFYVGLYSAYMVAFSIFIGKIINAFSQVFLPMASGGLSPQTLLASLLGKARKLFIPLVVGLFCLIWVVFKFYGKGFIFDPKLAFMIAVSNALYGFLVIIGNIVITIGIKGARIGVMFAIGSALINVIFNVLLIPRFHLYGTVTATILATIAIMIWAVRYIGQQNYESR